jgi:4-hydroxy-tetrahydrodipicolinate synthase
MGKMKYDRKSVKKWARENYRGLENVLLPTFTRDLTNLDEQGIRLDVRQTIKHGFTKTLIASDCGTTISELKRTIETVIDEAQGKIHTSLYLAFDNRKTQLEMLRFGQEVGIDNVLLHYPESESFNSEDDVYNYTKMISEASDIAINLYGSHKYNFGRFHPSMFSPRLIARMAELETVAGYKEGIIDFTHFAEVFELCGELLLPMSPVEAFHPVFVAKYGMQWAGGFPWEFYQDAESQQMVKNFRTMTEGKFKEATETYWRLAPVRYYIGASVGKQVELGMYNYNQWKYVQWLVGGAGGHVRMPCMKLYDHDKEALKFAMRLSGVKIREDAYGG